MKRLFLPITLLLSCASIYSMNFGSDLVGNPQLPTPCTNERHDLTFLFDKSPTLLHSIVAKYEKLNNLPDKTLSDVDKKLKKWKCSDLDELKIAYENNIIKIIKTLHTMGFDINARDDEGSTALNMAIVTTCSENIIKTLLDLGADPNIADSDNDTPLINAYEQHGNGGSIITLLISRGAYIMPLLEKYSLTDITKKSLGRSSAIITAISQLKPEQQKALCEKANLEREKMKLVHKIEIESEGEDSEETTDLNENLKKPTQQSLSSTQLINLWTNQY